MSDQGLVVRSEAIDAWAEEADLIVVGAGMAGTCAAIEAREAGADVLLVERASGGGGTSALSGGQVYLGGGTPVQKACGIEDTAEEMYKYLVAVSPDPDHAKIRAYCDGSIDHFNWLEAHGVPFERTYYTGKAVNTPGTECLILNGNEKVWPYRTQAKPAPRGHKVTAEGEGGGAVAMQRLTQTAHTVGVRSLYNTRAVALITAADGRIVGVRVRHNGEERNLRTRRGLVLASGGFNFNDEMIARYVPFLSQVDRHGTPNDDGFGHRAGAAAGGVLRHMTSALITSPFYPPGELLKGIVVNKDGKRFVAEDSYHGRTAAFVLEQPERKAYLILDSETFVYPEYKMHPLIDGWEDVAEMEQALAMPTGALQKTLAEYNRHAANGEDPELHKHPDWLTPLATAPYAAFDLSFGTATYVSGLTLGGLRISVDAQVLNEAGNPIPGFYAAGCCSSSIAQDPIGYASGTNLGQGGFFGRRAARHAMSQSL